MFSIELGADGLKLIDTAKKERTIREFKGRSLIDFPSEYILIDIETTGLDPRFDSIIEIGAIRLSGNKVLSSYNALVKPTNTYEDNTYVNSFITQLTGISNEMIEREGIPESKAIEGFIKFIQHDILVGYNVNFDINFLYDSSLQYLNIPMTNDFIDIMRIARKQLRELERHRLKDLIKYYGISDEDHHRALRDCRITGEVFTHLRKEIEQGIGLDEFTKYSKRSISKVKASDINAENDEFNTDNPLFGKYIVFTGKLENMIRKDAMQLVKNLGGEPQDRITKETNYLVLGDISYSKNVKGNATAKQKKAEKMKIEGQDIEVISESVFYDMLP